MIKNYFKKLRKNYLDTSIKRGSINYATIRLVDNFIFLYVNGHIVNVKEENDENLKIISEEMNNRRAFYVAVCYANNSCDENQ